MINTKTQALPVYIVEDDSAVRQSLAALLSAHGYTTRASASAEDFLVALDASEPFCLLLDLRLPRMSGIELQAHLNDIDAPCAIVVVTAHGDVPIAVQAMRAGAIDFIEKPPTQEQLLNALELAKLSFTSSPKSSVPRQVVNERLAKLTVREREVLDLLLAGNLNKEIASALGTSRRTIEVHRARIREKMQARGVADLIRMLG